MDLDWYFISDPLPGLAAARENRARLGCTGHPTGRPYLECIARSWATPGVAAEVVALHDGGHLKVRVRVRVRVTVTVTVTVRVLGC